MADERIWLIHPVTQGTFHCPNDAVPAWKARGWQECEPPAETNAAVAEYMPPPDVPEREPGADSPPDPKAPKPRRPAQPTASNEGVSSVG